MNLIDKKIEIRFEIDGDEIVKVISNFIEEGENE